MYIKNISEGAKGVNIRTGEGFETVYLEPGQSRDDIELSTSERASAESTGWFAFTPQADDAEEAAPEANSDLTNAEREELDFLRVENADLKMQLAELNAAKDVGNTDTPDQSGGDEPAKADDAPVAGLHAKHRGGGSYSIIDADGKEIVEKLNKADADAFNALSDEDKAAYVAPKD